MKSLIDISLTENWEHFNVQMVNSTTTPYTKYTALLN